MLGRAGVIRLDRSLRLSATRRCPIRWAGTSPCRIQRRIVDGATRNSIAASATVRYSSSTALMGPVLLPSARCHNAHTCSQRTRSLHRRQKNEAKMDNAFSQSLTEWTAFYALMGGAAATLLGLLFVAVSVRLNIFHQRQVADIRDFAAFTFGTFLVAIAVAGLALAPHAHRFTLALSLLLVSLAAFVAIAGIATKAALEHSGNRCRSGYAPDDWRGWA